MEPGKQTGAQGAEPSEPQLQAKGTAQEWPGQRATWHLWMLDYPTDARVNTEPPAHPLPLALDTGPCESLHWPASQAGTEFIQILADLTLTRQPTTSEVQAESSVLVGDCGDICEVGL